MKTTNIIILLIVFIIISNLIWFSQYYRLGLRNEYHKTEVCVTSYLNKLNTQFPVGSAYAFVMQRIKKIRFHHYTSSVIIDKNRIEVKPGDCNESGRPYCGFMLKFRNGYLIEIVDNYPCH